jgi:hypothetical protein
MRRSRQIITGVVVLAVFVVAWIRLPWRSWRYRGPGQFSDSGFVSYPRFHIRFPSLQLDRANAATFTFRGVPGERMNFQLYVQGAGEENRQELENLGTRIRATIIEETTSSAPRATVCAASGSPNAISARTRWVLMTGNDFAAFWQAACLHKQFRPNATYRLTIVIEPSEVSSPKFALIPTLEGGGIELP